MSKSLGFFFGFCDIEQKTCPIDNVVVGIIVICFAALLLGDAYLTTYNPASQILTPNDVKGIVGMMSVVIAGFIFWKAFRK